jgi:RNA polymerase sigma-70 factor (ECF subfamily)
MRRVETGPTDGHEEEVVSRIVSLQEAHRLDEAHRLFEIIYCRHARAVLARLSNSTSRNQAEDLAQETWLRAWRKLGTFKEGSFRAWILTIALNCRIDWQRRRTMLRLAVDADVPDGSAEVEREKLDRIEQAQVLRDCLSKLDERRRKVIAGLFYEKIDYEAVCRELGITASAAYKLTHEAKRLLVECCRRAMK